jgi:DNA-binding NarL/FixJ family response regulator
VDGKSKPRILAVDDEPSILEAIRLILEDDATLRLVGTATESESALRQTKRLKPDLVLMDLRLPGKSGIDTTREIKQLAPKIKILVLSGYPGGAEDALAVGARGFVVKGGPSDRLILAIKTVLSGSIFLDEQAWSLLQWKLLPFVETSLNKLKEEERLIVPFLLKGLTSKEIAKETQKTVRRIDRLRASMMRKLAVHNATGLISKLSH